MPNNNPVIPQSARTERIRISDTTTKVANPTNKLFTAGPNGSRIERIECMNAFQQTVAVPNVAPVQRILRIHLYIDGVYYLYKELFISPSINQIVMPPAIFNINGGLTIQAGVEIWVSQSAYTADKDSTSVTIYAKDF